MWIIFYGLLNLAAINEMAFGAIVLGLCAIAAESRRRSVYFVICALVGWRTLQYIIDVGLVMNKSVGDALEKLMGPMLFTAALIIFGGFVCWNSVCLAVFDEAKILPKEIPKPV